MSLFPRYLMKSQWHWKSTNKIQIQEYFRVHPSKLIYKMIKFLIFNNHNLYYINFRSDMFPIKSRIWKLGLHNSLHCSSFYQFTNRVPISKLDTKLERTGWQDRSSLLVGCNFSALVALVVECQIWLVAATLDHKTKPINIVFINRMMSSGFQECYCWKPQHVSHIVFENLQNS